MSRRISSRLRFEVCRALLIILWCLIVCVLTEVNRQHTWRFHVHIEDQRRIEAIDDQRQEEAVVNQQPQPKRRGMKPCDQSKSTTTSLEENPLERLSTEDWYRFIDIFAMLKIKRPREKEQHRNHRIDCLSKLWRSQYGHARPGYGLQGKFKPQINLHIELCSPPCPLH